MASPPQPPTDPLDDALLRRKLLAFVGCEEYEADAEEEAEAIEPVPAECALPLEAGPPVPPGTYEETGLGIEFLVLPEAAEATLPVLGNMFGGMEKPLLALSASRSLAVCGGEITCCKDRFSVAEAGRR